MPQKITARLCLRCGKTKETGHEPGAVDPTVLFCYRLGRGYNESPVGGREGWTYVPADGVPSGRDR